jgi:hypothetical protein
LPRLKLEGCTPRLRTACQIVALAATLGACSFTEEALWPSLSGNDPKTAAAPANSPPQRVEIQPSAAEIAATQPSSGPSIAQAGSTTPAPTQTIVGQRVQQMRGDVQKLQAQVAGNRATLEQMRNNAIQNSQRYYTIVGAINARLQVGTTPGNPILQGQWNEASSELDKISAEIGRMAQMTNDIASSAATSAFMLESIRAAYSLSGAVEEDHKALAQLEDEVNRAVVGVDRMLNELSEDINRQTAYVARERSNMTTLSVAIKNGELYGSGLGNRAFTAAAPLDGPAMAGTPASASSPSSAAAGRRPLMVIRFDRSNPAYEQALYTAVSRALERRPQAAFDVVAVAPNKGNQAQVALASTNAKRQAEQVQRSLSDMGLPPDRVKLSASTSAQIQANEVHIYVR